MASNVLFVQPFLVNAETAAQIEGERVLVVDVAFNGGRLPQGMVPGSDEAAAELRKQFEDTTGALIEALGDRLVAWVDHHPHSMWDVYGTDARFHLFERDDAPSLPSIITPELVEQIGEFDAIIAHGDFDGIMSAVMFELDGERPYYSAVRDSVAADARVGTMTKKGQMLEAAMKANLRDDSMRLAIFQQLVNEARVKAAAKAYEVKEAVTREVNGWYKARGIVAVVDATSEERDFDLTQVLLHGQRNVDGAKVAIVLHKSLHDGTDVLTVAGPASYNFPTLLGLGGGAPFRATVNADRLDEVVELVNNAS